MTKRGMALVAVGAMLSVAVSVGVENWRMARREDNAPAAADPVGRYIIYRQGDTRTFEPHTLLLDTSNGDTWRLCEGRDGTRWCYLTDIRYHPVASPDGFGPEEPVDSGVVLKLKPHNK